MSRRFVVAFQRAFRNIVPGVVPLDTFTHSFQCGVKRVFAEIQEGDLHMSPVIPPIERERAILELLKQVAIMHLGPSVVAVVFFDAHQTTAGQR